MNKEFWMENGSAHVNDGNSDFSNTARAGPKRSHQLFVDTAEPELYPSKKQELQNIHCKPSSEMLYPPINPWENTSNLQSLSNQFMDRLFGNETPSTINFAERNLSSVETNDVNESQKENDNQFREGLPVGLSISDVMEDPETCLSYAGVRKVKVNQVKEYDSDITASRVPGSNNVLSVVQPFNRENETSFVSIGQAYYKERDSMALVGHTDDNTGNVQIRSAAPNYVRGDENTISMVDNFVKDDTSIISFGGFPEEQDIIPGERPLGSYDQLCQPASVMSDTVSEKELDALNTITILNSSHAVKPRTDTVSKNNPDSKTARKRAPNSFPSNVRSLISTGMLDGVPVKYVSLAREELRGIIRGSGYLCGCQSCNYAKVLNAYEFERHAGCKTKHPNNHVYFENGKTIYQIVQELRNTPTSLLFDTIQTVFGAPINQKSFRTWKESFQAATRELQRIYGKEELNL